MLDNPSGRQAYPHLSKARYLLRERVFEEEGAAAGALPIGYIAHSQFVQLSLSLF